MNIAAIWHYRGFIMGSVAREFRVRYQTSVLGTTWAVLNPLALVFIYTVVFSRLMRARLPGIENALGYGIYLCAGILCWSTFTEIATRCQNVFLENANLIRKMSFPRLCLPLIVVISAAISFMIMLVILLTFLVLAKNPIGFSILAIVPLFLLLIAFAASLGVILGVLNVFFRDVGQLFGIVFQFWFWLTPIVYPISALPDKIQRVIRLNPLTPLVEAYQGIFVSGVWPQWSSLFPTILAAGFLAVVALRLYRKCSVDMVDEL
jgi:homopolymeric O-antigen transport system permease protein